MSSRNPSSSFYLMAAAGAILIWSTLAVSVTFCNTLNPMFITGAALSVGGIIGLPWLRFWKMPKRLLAVGTACMLGYHVIYFYALQLADPIGVSLIHYLWPILIVLLGPLFVQNGKASLRCLLAGVAGFVGALVSCRPGQLDDLSNLAGYGLAFLSAVVWAAYSLTSKRYPEVKSASVGLFCMISGLACLTLYLSSAPWPTLTTNESLALLYMGVGPMGGAFYLWDFAMKKADHQTVAVLSYATPVLSTAFLAFYLGQGMEVSIWIGAALVALSMAMAAGGSTAPQNHQSTSAWFKRYSKGPTVPSGSDAQL
ncbi:DMT family transporter [Pseudomonas sp. Z18(2022)]|uniref:DMT family transporter n=1 Tax=Pseudomonas sp. Z18(2022) TaxID=2983410 RepID=UPI002E80B7BA|nr:EamA family transporter [Pseudomonas sp. Z18(2022)]